MQCALDTCKCIYTCMYLDEYEKGIYMYMYSGIQFCTIAQFLIENVPFQTSNKISKSRQKRTTNNQESR